MNPARVREFGSCLLSSEHRDRSISLGSGSVPGRGEQHAFCNVPPLVPLPDLLLVAPTSQKWDIPRGATRPGRRREAVHWVASSKRDFWTSRGQSRRTSATPVESPSLAGRLLRPSRGKGLAQVSWRSSSRTTGTPTGLSTPCASRRPSTCCTPSRRSHPPASGRPSVTSISSPERLKAAQKDHEEHYGKSKR